MRSRRRKNFISIDMMTFIHYKCVWVTCVKTAAAVDQERHGTSTNGFGQFVAANEAICAERTKHIFP